MPVSSTTNPAPTTTDTTSARPKQQRKTKRRLLRFSLRSFLLSITLLGCGLGFWTSTIQPLQKEWKAAALFRSLNGKVETHPPHLSPWLVACLPEGQYEHIKTVRFETRKWDPYAHVNDESIAALKQLPHLEQLYLPRAGVSNKHLETISQLKSIRKLSLWGNNLHDDGITQLSELPNLQVIDLGETKVTMACLSKFRTDVEIRLDQNTFELDTPLIQTLKPTRTDIQSIILNAPTLAEVTKVIEFVPQMRTLLIESGEHLPVGAIDTIAEYVLDSPSQRSKPLRIYLMDDQRFGQESLISFSKKWKPQINRVIAEATTSFKNIPGMIYPHPYNRRFLAESCLTLSLNRSSNQIPLEIGFRLNKENFYRFKIPRLIDHLADVQEIQFCRNDPVWDELPLMQMFSEFDSIQQLTISADRISPETIEQIRRLQSIRTLTIDRAAVRQELFDNLLNLRHLRLTGRNYFYRNEKQRLKEIVKSVPKLESIMLQGKDILPEFHSQNSLRVLRD